jgi:transposase InsO family protein
VLGDEKAASATALLHRALGFFARYGVRVERVMTDNGSAYRAHKHRLACQRLGLKHLFTQPYRPRTNGKAERFIQTLINDWGRGRLYANSAERTAALDAWLDHYNFSRPHGSLSHKPPGSRLTNAPRNYRVPPDGRAPRTAGERPARGARGRAARARSTQAP